MDVERLPRAAAFGAAPPDGPGEAYIGLAPMRNTPGADWPRWYAEQSLAAARYYSRTSIGWCGANSSPRGQALAKSQLTGSTRTILLTSRQRSGLLTRPVTSGNADLRL